MTWNQFFREIDRAQRRSERSALQRHRQLMREQAFHDKLAQHAEARNQVAQFDSYLAVLVSVHKDCGDRWEWQQIAQSPEPAAPAPTSTHEDKARLALGNYRPSLLDKLLRRVEKKGAALEAAVRTALAHDQGDHAAAQEAHRKSVAEWASARTIAAAVLQRDPDGYRRALELANPFAELAEFKTRVSVASAELDVVALSCHLEDEDLVPREELKLTASGKLSHKDMAAGRYWALHQDYVCSCALRVARETFAVLPIERVIVNVSARRMDSSTGHMASMTILGVHFTRTALQRINYETLDPSDSLKNFNARMKFKKTAGFEPVEPITPDEQWVSA